MSFRSVLTASWRPDDRLELRAPLVYETRAGETITVPAGFVTDLASVPRGLRNLAPRWNRSAEAAVLHDFAYVRGGSRRKADALFYEALRESGVSRLGSWMMWAGVRLGASFAWRGHRKRERQGK